MYILPNPFQVVFHIPLFIDSTLVNRYKLPLLSSFFLSFYPVQFSSPLFAYPQSVYLILSTGVLYFLFYLSGHSWVALELIATIVTLINRAIHFLKQSWLRNHQLSSISLAGIIVILEQPFALNPIPFYQILTYFILALKAIKYFPVMCTTLVFNSSDKLYQLHSMQIHCFSVYFCLRLC